MLDATKMLAMSIDDFQPNTYNPNVMPDPLFQALMDDIKTNGFTIPIIARPRGEEADPAYEIVDGEHRWRAAKQLGFKNILAIIRAYDRPEDAMIATFRFNHERGFFDPEKTKDLILELSKTIILDDLVKQLGMSPEEILQYLPAKLVPEDWKPPEIEEETPPHPEEREALTFWLKHDQKARVQKTMDEYAKKHKLKDPNQVFYKMISKAN